MQRFKKFRLWLIIGLGVIPFTGLPMAVQVGLAVGVVVLLMALSSVARNPGTVGDSTSDGGEAVSHGPGPWGSGHPAQTAHHATSGESAPSGHPSGGHGGGAADSGQAADGGGDGGGGDGGGGGGGD